MTDSRDDMTSIELDVDSESNSLIERKRKRTHSGEGQGETKADTNVETKRVGNNFNTPRKNRTPRRGKRGDAGHSQHVKNGATDHASEVTGEERDREMKQPPPKKKKKARFCFGNYDRYYGYRAGSGSDAHNQRVWNDPRLGVLKDAWFRGKKCLDIGCNAGYLTISMAERFGPRLQMGVDLDTALVSKARRLVRERATQREEMRHRVAARSSAIISSTSSTPAPASSSSLTSSSSSSSASAAMATTACETEAPSASSSSHSSSSGGLVPLRPPLSFCPVPPPLPLPTSTPSPSTTTPTTAAAAALTATSTSAPAASTSAVASASVPTTAAAAAAAVSEAPVAPSLLPPLPPANEDPFPDNCMFLRQNFVTEAHTGADYDVITCFSVTKWMQLNHGDEGLRRALRNVHRLLRPGGRFIVEPQPWKSYGKNKNVSEVTKANYAEILLRPDDFPTFLLQVVGFEKFELIRAPEGASKGFRRDIYVYTKRGDSSSSCSSSSSGSSCSSLVGSGSG